MLTTQDIREMHFCNKQMNTIVRVRMHKQQHAKSRYQRRQMKWRAKWWRKVFSPARLMSESFMAGWHRGAWT